ncbi:MAG: ABC transporter ATP-binding protein [Phycisphaerales bacterium]|nr:MAG: ABC transporter ATP-binding protein [Phycisphaerales bacterium]
MVKAETNTARVIDLSDVRKTYRGKVQALRGIRMQVDPGEIFGLLGPNGAGKSTLVKIMMTVVRPSHVEGTMLGQPIGHKPTLKRVGYLPEHHRMPPYLTGRQIIEFFGALADVDRRTRKQRADELLELVSMTEWAGKKISTYSKGMQQRIGLAQALVNDPELVVLDEPTDGVDPVGRRDIRDVLVRLREQGKTVFLNSHLLSELEMVCGRVAILVQGDVVMQGTIDDLTADSRRYEIVFAGRSPQWVESDATIRTEVLPDKRTKLTLKGAEPQAVQPILDRLRQDEVTIISLRPVRETLEDLFMRAVVDPVTGQTLKPGASKAQGQRAATPTSASFSDETHAKGPKA